MGYCNGLVGFLVFLQHERAVRWCFRITNSSHHSTSIPSTPFHYLSFRSLPNFPPIYPIEKPIPPLLFEYPLILSESLFFDSLLRNVGKMDGGWFIFRGFGWLVVVKLFGGEDMGLVVRRCGWAYHFAAG